MTTKELASMLNGREIMKEITPSEERQAADAGLVVVFGYSDDTTELRGAINGEMDCFDGGAAYITKRGFLQDPACNTVAGCACPYLVDVRKKARTIKAVWHDDGDPCWTYETDIPHETFNIYESGELFCVGIVFSVDSLVEA